MANGFEECMNNVQESLNIARNNLIQERTALREMEDLYKREQEKWRKDLAHQRVTFNTKKSMIERIEEKTLKLRQELDLRSRTLSDLVTEYESLTGDLERAEDLELRRQNLEIDSLRKELERIQDKLLTINETRTWEKMVQEHDDKLQRETEEKRLSREMEKLADEFRRQVETFEDHLETIKQGSLIPTKEKLKYSQNYLAELQAECDALERENKQLESKISQMKRST